MIRALAKRALHALGAAAIGLSLVVVAAPSAHAIGNTPVSTAPAAQLVHQATTDSDPFDLPGGALTLPMAQGEVVWLYTTGLVASTTYANQTPDPGVSFIVQCYGPGIAASGTGWYVGRNLDPPNNTLTFAPQIRTMFMPPTSGTYTCKIRVGAYQPNSAITIPVTIHAGAQLHATPVKAASSLGVTAGFGWATPNSGTAAQPVISGTHQTLVHDPGSYTFTSSASPTVTVIEDQDVTTCEPGDSFTGCGSPSFTGSTVKATLLVQPENLDGSTCGRSTPLAASVQTMTVKPAYHHAPMINTAVLNKATDLFGCPRVGVSLSLTWLSGEPVVVHELRPHDERPSWGGIYEH